MSLDAFSVLMESEEQVREERTLGREARELTATTAALLVHI